jgi:tight adherence protein C
MNVVSLGLGLVALVVIALASFQSKGKLSTRVGARPNLQVTEPKARAHSYSEFLLEIPDFASLIGFAVSAGESLESALRIAVSRSTGVLSREFAALISQVDHGAVLGIELEKLATEAQSEQVRELASKLALASANGSALSDLIADYVQSSVQELKAHLLDRAGKNETKMMIPLVFVILPITVMFAVYPSLTLIQSSFL